MSLRIGMGYDIHRLVPGRRLVLGGVDIPFEKGCEAHSDGDVLIHAIMDSLLGAAGEGDIGCHFPSTDEYQGADSSRLLETVIRLLSDKGWKPVNVDTVVITEEPAISPHFESMRAHLSALVGATVSVKATTNERVGAIGRKEALAAMAVSLISKE